MLYTPDALVLTVTQKRDGKVINQLRSVISDYGKTMIHNNYNATNGTEISIFEKQ